jgi:hypothetical protein
MPTLQRLAHRGRLRDHDDEIVIPAFDGTTDYAVLQNVATRAASASAMIRATTIKDTEPQFGDSFDQWRRDAQARLQGRSERRGVERAQQAYNSSRSKIKTPERPELTFPETRSRNRFGSSELATHPFTLNLSRRIPWHAAANCYFVYLAAPHKRVV